MLGKCGGPARSGADNRKRKTILRLAITERETGAGGHERNFGSSPSSGHLENSMEATS